MRTSLIAAMAVLLVACRSDSTGSEEPPINGTWRGQGPRYSGRNVVFEMTLDATSLPRQGVATMTEEGWETGHWDVRAHTRGDSVWVDTNPAGINPVFEGVISGSTITGVMEPRGGDEVHMVLSLIHR